MWAIKIGESHKHICAAHTVRNLGRDYSISENSESFWISEKFLNIGMKIFIGTREYNKLRKLLDVKAEDDVIITWIKKLLIQKASVEVLTQAIDNNAREAYRQGRNDVKNDFLNLMRME